MPLTLILNGSKRELETLADKAHLAEVVTALELKADRIAVEHNGAIAPRKDWSAVIVSSGDRLEVVHFVGGGTETCDITRRKSAIALSLMVCFPRLAWSQTSSLSSELAALEKRKGGRLGVAVLDTGTSKLTGYRLDERFPMCSTFKLMLVAAVLQRTDSNHEHLDRAVSIPPKPLIGNSPLTEENAGGKMTVQALCHASITRSDNTASNLLLSTLGGPAGYTQFARSLGDEVTRLDRIETSLNESRPGDPRDTTSPAATARNMQKLLIGSVLTKMSRERLVAWLIENKTGEECLRAGLPPEWRVGDKTGSNGDTTRNDIAVIWPGNRPPILLTAYLTEFPGTDALRNPILAEVGHFVSRALLEA